MCSSELKRCNGNNGVHIKMLRNKQMVRTISYGLGRQREWSFFGGGLWVSFVLEFKVSWSLEKLMHWTMLLWLHFIMCNQICGVQHSIRIEPMLCHGWILGFVLCDFCLFKCALIFRLMSKFPHYFDYLMYQASHLVAPLEVGQYSL